MQTYIRMHTHSILHAYTHMHTVVSQCFSLNDVYETPFSELALAEEVCDVICIPTSKSRRSGNHL